MTQENQEGHDGSAHALVRERAVDVVRALRAAGHQALFAGGCVRDHLLGRTPVDYDVATSATPQEVMALFDRTVPVGVAFGVVRVLIDDHEFEVATFRTEGGYSDGRRPDAVTWSTPRDDVLRRDFTINGLLLDPLDGAESIGKVIDHVGGVADLHDGILRAIGEPNERFEEDKLRLLRAVRFATRFDFAIEETTWDAIVIRAPEIVEVSAERIRDELERMWTQSVPGPGFSLLAESGLWRHLLPEIAEPDRVLARLRRASTLSAEAGWTTLCADLTPRAAEALGRRMKLSTARIRHVSEAVATHRSLTGYEDLSVAARKRLLREPPAKTALDVASLTHLAGQRSSAPTDQARADLRRWSASDLFPETLINGGDLIAQGHAPGPAFKEALAAVEDALLEGATLDRETAMSIALEQLAAS